MTKATTEITVLQSVASQLSSLNGTAIAFDRIVSEMQDEAKERYIEFLNEDLERDYQPDSSDCNYSGEMDDLIDTNTGSLDAEDCFYLFKDELTYNGQSLARFEFGDDGVTAENEVTSSLYLYLSQVAWEAVSDCEDEAWSYYESLYETKTEYDEKIEEIDDLDEDECDDYKADLDSLQSEADEIAGRFEQAMKDATDAGYSFDFEIDN